MKVFGEENVNTATGKEEYAYASYVREYNTGKFKKARDMAESALGTMTR